jgi:hypothetical protein
MRIAVLLSASSSVWLAGCVAGDEPSDPEPHVRAANVPGAIARTKNTGPVIDHNGAVLATSTTYAIYWGPAADFPADLESGMATLLGGFAGSSYIGIAQQYMRGTPIATSYAGSVADPSAPPRIAPNTATIAAEACALFPNPDPNALYIVFTSNAPKVNYCAWHNKATCNGVSIQVAYVPNQAQLPNCSPYTAAHLGCNAYSDGTVTSADSVAHELMETISDPHIDAWYDANRAEIGDKCDYQYASCVALPNGSSWQIQSEWSNAIGGCQQQ